MNFSDSSLHKKINSETSKMPWQELQRFFAGGSVVWIAGDLDLVEVAYQFSQDNQAQVRQWIETEKISKVTDLQAKNWFINNIILWTVVIKPWILVQEIRQ